MKTGQAADTDYEGLFYRLWPRGAFHQALRAVGRPLQLLLLGLAAEPARVHNRVIDAWAEVDPRSATETLATWETMTGITTPATTTAARRLNIHAALTAGGGNNPARFTALALKLGAVVVITAPYRPAFRVDESHVDDRLEDRASGFIWNTAGTCPTAMRTTLEDLFDVYTPAHIQNEYTYT